jgi:hypothetical protein
MPYITQEMIDHAQTDVANAQEADIIKGLGGLGGCKTMDQAPAEVAKWFDRDCSVAEVIFNAMDHLCSTPHGRAPSPKMIEAGNDVLGWLFNVKLAEPSVRVDASLMADVPLHLQPYMFSAEPPCAHVYRKMREVDGFSPAEPEIGANNSVELTENRAQIEIMEKDGKIHCFRSEYRPVKRRLTRIRISTQSAKLATVSHSARENMYPFEVIQLEKWLSERARNQRIETLVSGLDNAPETISQFTEALSLPGSVHGLEQHRAYALWSALTDLQDALRKAGFPNIG